MSGGVWGEEDMPIDMKPVSHRARGILRGAGDLLWPPRSLVGGARGAHAGPLAPGEFAALHFITGPVCGVCGSPMEVDLGPQAICAPCSARRSPWRRARAALVYDEVSRRPILDLKRSGRRDGLGVLSGWMVQGVDPSRPSSGQLACASALNKPEYWSD